MTLPEDPPRSENATHTPPPRKSQRFEHDYWTRVINGTPTIVCGISPDGITTFINAAGEEITGYAADEIVDRNWWQTFYPGDEYRQVERLQRKLKEGDVRDYEMTLTTRQGKKCTLLWTSLKQHDASGQLVEIIGFGNDVTQRKRAESLMRAQRDLGMALSAETDLTHALETCLDAALTASDMECGGVYLLNRNGGYDLSVHKGLTEEFAKSEVSYVAGSPHIKFFETSEPIYIDNQLDSTEIQNLMKKAGFSVAACLPVIHEGETIARLNLASFRLNEIPRASRDALETITAQIGTAIVRIGAEEKLRAEQQFLKQLIELQERERKIIAYEIHDGLAQHIAGGLMQMQAVQQFPDRHCEQAEKLFDTGLQLLGEGLTEARSLIAGLRPIILDEMGIIAAVNHLINEAARREDIEIEFVHQKDSRRLLPTLETAVFRVVQEALTNVCRHSQSKKACVELIVKNGRLHAKIEDWGIGFDPDRVEQKRFGLRGIRERAELIGGRAIVDSSPGNGTRIKVEFPLSENAPDA
ncbi:MAG: PAS domain S-box protein [Pirellulales bacterium]|nr:PAS domain S-box protein [Pirellulales bacterium]